MRGVVYYANLLNFILSFFLLYFFFLFSFYRSSFFLSFFLLGRTSATYVGAEGYCCTWSHSFTNKNTHTLSRTPLDEGSAHRRNLYLTTQQPDIHALGGTIHRILYQVKWSRHYINHSSPFSAEVKKECNLISTDLKDLHVLKGNNFALPLIN